MVASQRRYEGACNRVADASVPFCEKGGATFGVSSALSEKKRNERIYICSDAGAGFEPHDLRVITCGAALLLTKNSRKYLLNFLTAAEIAALLSLPPAAERTNSQRATLVGLITLSSVFKIFRAKQNRRLPIGKQRFFLVAGAGFEPHDLRVMSPTSYQTALPRDIDLTCVLYH